ncbi:uncharacterized protein YALI1_A01241g [Yarrowia lipolytica]|uniref:Uncharacterized protein n=1 Tax=Yarrowia lipolytica TaxID=4952 RepID=A0A1D8N3B2_YARLL|nr:hypothetical protein YALI1_A01241g [Yarrowia lipolytica]
MVLYMNKTTQASETSVVHITLASDVPIHHLGHLLTVYSTYLRIHFSRGPVLALSGISLHPRVHSGLQ